MAFFLRSPRNDRDWSPDQAVLVGVQYGDGEAVTLHNVRNIRYRTETDYDVRFEEFTTNTSEVISVEMVVAPFGSPGIAHTFLVFHFSDGRTLALSVEVRKQKGQEFSVWRVVPHTFELMYVWGSEEDIVKLRTDIWRTRISRHSLVLSRDKMKKLFEDALARTNALAHKPEFYNAFSNNCTTNLIVHFRRAGVALPRAHWRYVWARSLTKLFRAHGLLGPEH